MARRRACLQERTPDERPHPSSRQPGRHRARTRPQSRICVEALQGSRRDHPGKLPTHDGPPDGRQGGRVLQHEGDDSSYHRIYHQPAIMSRHVILDIQHETGYAHPAVESVAKAQRVGRVQRAQSGTTALTIRCGQVVTTPRPPLIHATRKTEDKRQDLLTHTSVGKSRQSVHSILTQRVEQEMSL